MHFQKALFNVLLLTTATYEALLDILLNIRLIWRSESPTSAPISSIERYYLYSLP